LATLGRGGPPLTAKRPDPPPLAATDGLGRTAELIDLLVTVGYIDGQFHQREQAFIERYLESVLLVVDAQHSGTVEERVRARAAYQRHFDEVYARLEAVVARLSGEVMTSGDESYVPTRLKVRALTLFQALPASEQTTALELVRAMMHADGLVSQPEQLLYDELLAYFTTARRDGHATAPTLVGKPAVTPGATRPLEVVRAPTPPLQALAHPLLDPLEQTYSPHPRELQAQVALDYQLVSQAMIAWHRQRAVGTGQLTGKTDIGQLPIGCEFLDGYVYAQRPSQPMELVVLGDLHGCYSCLKAALLQTNFVNRVWAHQWDPAHHPDVKLVLLGDYIDRGRFSYNGMLRTVMQLFVGRARPRRTCCAATTSTTSSTRAASTAASSRPRRINTLVGTCRARCSRPTCSSSSSSPTCSCSTDDVRPRRHPARRRRGDALHRPGRRSTIPICGSRCCGAIRRAADYIPDELQARTPASRSDACSSRSS
jgi:hypothetical protein